MIKHLFKKENIGFAGLQWFFFSGVCSVLAFMVLYLDSLGLNETKIGFLMSAIAVTTIVGQPFWGNFCDKNHSIRNTLIFSLLASGIVALFIPLVSNYYFLIIAICIIVAFTENSMPAIIDSWILNMSGDKPWIDYGFTRGMGSLGFALTAIFLGVFLDRNGYEMMFYTHFVFILLSILFLFIIEPKKDIKTHRPVASRGKFALYNFSIKENSKFLIFLLAATLTIIGFRANATFFPLLLAEKGGDNSSLGISLFVMAASEFPVLFLSKKLLSKFKDTSIILVSMFFFIIRIYLNIVIDSPTLLIAVQFTQGLSFALFLPAAIYYIRRLAPVGRTSTYLTVATSVYFGLGGVIGNFFGGLIISKYTMKHMLSASMGLAILGMLVFLFFVVLKNKKEETA